MTKINYQEYIHSDAWKAMRQEFFQWILFEGFCAACGGIPLGNQLNVHHMTYSRLGEERLEDLVALCGSCHLNLHKYHEESPKLTLWSASQLFIKNSRKEAGLPKYLFFSHEFTYKAHRNRPDVIARKAAFSKLCRESEDLTRFDKDIEAPTPAPEFVPKNRRPGYKSDWRKECRPFSEVDSTEALDKGSVPVRESDPIIGRPHQ